MHALGETRLDWLVWRLARSLVNKSEIQNEYDGILRNFRSTQEAIKNRLAAELTSRYSGTGPKYKWNSSLHCSEFFYNDKD